MLEKISDLFAQLPGLGPRSARRILLHLVKNKHELLNPFITGLQDLATKIQTCKKCFSLDMTNPCKICTDPKRSIKTLCIVAEVSDIWAIERSSTYKGLYHVLGGILSAVEGHSPETLNINTLLERVKKESFEEIIIALNPTVDGQTTTHYITELLKPYPIKLTTLAHGIPLGGELDYIDNGTISMAFANRTKFG